MDIVQLRADVTARTTNSPVAAGERIAKKFPDAHAWAQASLAAAKDEQEKQANRHRDPAPAYKPGDKVWLNLRNWKTNCPSKKLDARAALYIVQAAIGSHAYRLDTPPGVHPAFHTRLLRPAANDPLPSQRIQHYEPPAVLVPDDEGSPQKNGMLRKSSMSENEALETTATPSSLLNGLATINQPGNHANSSKTPKLWIASTSPGDVRLTRESGGGLM